MGRLKHEPRRPKLNDRCKECQYRASIYEQNGCNYILIEGYSRGCPVEGCDKFVKGNIIRAGIFKLHGKRFGENL